MISTKIKNIKDSELEQYFNQFRENIVGIDLEFESPYGTKKIVYTDWTASGRLYRPIEEKILNDFGPYVANTHTETTESGTAMTMVYHKAKAIIKTHVNSNEDDILILSGSGMTSVVNKFQRILGLKMPENLQQYATIPDEKKPIIFITHITTQRKQLNYYPKTNDKSIAITSRNCCFQSNSRTALGMTAYFPEPQITAPPWLSRR